MRPGGLGSRRQDSRPRARVNAAHGPAEVPNHVQSPAPSSLRRLEPSGPYRTTNPVAGRPAGADRSPTWRPALLGAVVLPGHQRAEQQSCRKPRREVRDTVAEGHARNRPSERDQRGQACRCQEAPALRAHDADSARVAVQRISEGPPCDGGRAGSIDRGSVLMVELRERKTSRLRVMARRRGDAGRLGRPRRRV